MRIPPLLGALFLVTPRLPLYFLGVDLDVLALMIGSCWTAETAVDPSAWTPSCPERGQCAVTALVVQDWLGGALLRAEAPGGSHYFGRLPDGTEADLTRGQFPGWTPGTVEERPRPRVLAHPGTAARYLLLRRAVSTSASCEEPGLFTEYAAVDWLTTGRWRCLHAVRFEDWTAAHRDDMAFLWYVATPVRLACGRTASELHIPGIFSRGGFGGGLPRCKGCCRALGGPAGLGSPKNSSEWRALLGLD